MAFTKGRYDVKKCINRRKMKGICFCIFLYIDVFNLGFYGIIQLIGRHKVKIKIKQSVKKRRTDTSAFFMEKFNFITKNFQKRE